MILSPSDIRTVLRLHAARAGSRATRLPRAVGSRATLGDLLVTASPRAPQNPRSQARAQAPRAQAQRPIRTTRAKVNEASMWILAAEKMYGSYVDTPVVATREALQNSLDAIRSAELEGILQPGSGRFDVTWDPEQRSLTWADNGIGMSDDVVDNVFLSLGDTTKIATRSNREIQIGGFGLAKAILLGTSQSFDWTLHSRHHRFEGRGFHTPIEVYRAPPRSGVSLTVRDVNPKFLRYVWGGWTEGTLLERLFAYLSSCNVPVAIRLNGDPVRPMFQGDGERLAEGADWGSGVNAIVRGYARNDPGGRIWVRVRGQTQFVKPYANGEGRVDVVVDLDPRVDVRSEESPLLASRMGLSGRAESALYQMADDLTRNILSASQIRGLHFVDAGHESPSGGDLDAGFAEILRRDPQLGALFQRAEGLQQIFQRVMNDVRSQASDARAQNPDPQHGKSVSHAPSADLAKEIAREEKAFLDLVERGDVVPETPPTKAKKSLPKTSGDNPWSAVAHLQVNPKTWTPTRLAAYTHAPKALLPLLTVWRAIVRILLASKGRNHAFDVGLLFDDDTLAEYIPATLSPSGRPIYSIQPAPVLRLAREDGTAEVIAAYLLHCGCHEVTHGLGLSDHDERFSAVRERLGEETAALLTPLMRLTTTAFGLKGLKKKRAPKADPEPTIPMIDYQVPSEAIPTLAREIARRLHARNPRVQFTVSDDSSSHSSLTSNTAHVVVWYDEVAGAPIHKTYRELFDDARGTDPRVLPNAAIDAIVDAIATATVSGSTNRDRVAALRQARVVLGRIP